MPKRVLSILAVLLIASVLMTGLSLAQTDSDGDTVEDSQDRCPLTPGTPRYGGCPEFDMDGDGLNNFIDQCVRRAGPAENQGCPLDQQSTDVPQQPSQPDSSGSVPPTGTPEPVVIPPAQIGPEEPCAVSSLGSRVNVREFPSTQAPIIGQLLPGEKYLVIGVAYFGDQTWFAVDSGWVSGTAVVAGGLCGEVPRLQVPSDGLTDPSKYDESWPEEWDGIVTDPTKGEASVAFDFPDDEGGTFLRYKLENVIVTGLTDLEPDSLPAQVKMTEVLVTSYLTGDDGKPTFKGGYLLSDLGGESNLLQLLILPDPETEDPGGVFVGALFGDGSVKIASMASALSNLNGAGQDGLLLPYIEQDNLKGLVGLDSFLLLPYIEQDNLRGYLEQENVPDILELGSFELMIDRNSPAPQAGSGPHVKVFNGSGITDGTSNITDGTSNITDGTSNTFFDFFADPPDPDSYTREHVLLARQVGAPAAADGSVMPGDGSVIPGDGSVRPADLILSFGVGDPTGLGLLLPAVQKVREAAN